MSVLIDTEFGSITLRRSARASSVRLRVGPDGKLKASLPRYSPIFLVKRLVSKSRPQIRDMLRQHAGGMVFTDGMTIGKRHTIVTSASTNPNTSVLKHGNQIIVRLSPESNIEDATIQQTIRSHAIEALRSEAKDYLPRRLALLAEKHGFSYLKVRLSHTSTRWGSCSSNGTISLNIALMQLSFDQMDYVILHELCHTREMNHSHEFWRQVGQYDKYFEAHRSQLKNLSPAI